MALNNVRKVKRRESTCNYSLEGGLGALLEGSWGPLDGSSMSSHIASAIVESTCFAFPFFRSLCFCPGDLFVELWFTQCTSVVGAECHQDLILKAPCTRN